MIEYTTLEIEIPKGYDEQIKRFVMVKIEAILSTIVLSKTPEEKSQFIAEVDNAYTKNDITKM